MKSGGAGNGKKVSRYDVWCGGIVFHASSPLASPPVSCAYGGMCRLRTTGRKRVLTASSKHSQPICLFVCMLRYKMARPLQLQSCALTTSALWVWSIIQPCQDTSWLTIAGSKSIFSSISYWIVPLAGVQEWTSAHWEEGKNVEVDRREGPIAFFQFTTIRNRFSTISLN